MNHRGIKFRYVFKRKSDALINIVIADITQIESTSGNHLNIYFNPYWELIARDEHTGIKDRNGKEIYEGDIIKIPDSEKLRVVIFDNGAFKLKIIGDFSLIYTALGYYFRVKKLGNEYENSELLEI